MPTWREAATSLCALLVSLLISASACAGLMSTYSSSTTYGEVVVPEFDASLGILTRATMSTTLSGSTYGEYASTWGGVSGDHEFDISAGPLTLTGTTYRGYQPSGWSSYHTHQIYEWSSSVFEGADLSLFDQGAAYALPENAMTAPSDVDGHDHEIRTSSMRVYSSTTFTYLPFSDLGVLEVVTNAVGEIVLPGFDSSLGELLQANVNTEWSDGETSSSYSPYEYNHGHVYNDPLLGPLRFSGTVDPGASGPGWHAHSFDGGSSNGIFRGTDLSHFAAGGTTVDLPFAYTNPSYYSGFYGYYGHQHWLSPFDLSTTTTTTFYYLPAAVNASTPEPASVSLFGLGALGIGFGARRRKKRSNEGGERRRE